ncbi:MAG: DeoR/GlpR transcriptional regulator [Clostridia bacterium]|nr:DeoR/GlpR transcriptional regulator [Clostridia bacterium]
MLKDERYDKILKILDDEKYVSSYELSKRLFVSMPTIRRDLAYLEKTKQIVRNHGGARKINGEYMVMPLAFRETVNHGAKKQLCEAASKLIKEDSIVFLDGSTTVLQIADFISPKQNIMVITNGIPLSLILIKKGIKTYTTGGELIENSMAYAGSFAEEFICRFNIDTCFFSSHGVNENGIIVDTSLPETQLRARVISQSAKSVFLCDKTKFGVSAPYNLMPVGDVDCVVTDCEKENEKN